MGQCFLTTKRCPLPSVASHWGGCGFDSQLGVVVSAGDAVIGDIRMVKGCKVGQREPRAAVFRSYWLSSLRKTSFHGSCYHAFRSQPPECLSNVSHSGWGWRGKVNAARITWSKQCDNTSRWEPQPLRCLLRYDKQRFFSFFFGFSLFNTVKLIESRLVYFKLFLTICKSNSYSSSVCNRAISNDTKST